MRVAGLWRYPVKSMRGESRDTLEVAERGVAGDRAFGVLDIGSGTIISAKKDGRLLEAQAVMAGAELAIRLPNGETVLGCGLDADRALSAWLGRRVSLVAAEQGRRATYEMPVDFEDDGSEPLRWQGPEGSFVDSSPVHIVTTATLSSMAAERPDLQWSVSRFRPNLLIEVDGGGFPEQEWIGARLQAGPAVLAVYKSCSRCVMTTRAQPGGTIRQLDILRHINQAHGTNLGVLARVSTPGTLELGMEVRLAT
jgi:uncharacterized protein YcbX